VDLQTVAERCQAARARAVVLRNDTRRVLEEAEQLSQLSRETLARQTGSTSHSPMKPTSARSSSDAPRSRT
jgi:hypothetical protein